ncbi:hypothetical protein CSC12_2980 [Klebsiella michiganensis]|nr:hypothetical protein CSC12_2980 [Klebsiella michiganensis]
MFRRVSNISRYGRCAEGQGGKRPVNQVILFHRIIKRYCNLLF